MATPSTQVQVSQITHWDDYKSPVNGPSDAMVALLKEHGKQCAEWLLKNNRADERGIIYLHIQDGSAIPRWFSLALYWLARDASAWEIKFAPFMGTTIYRLKNLAHEPPQNKP